MRLVALMLLALVQHDHAVGVVRGKGLALCHGLAVQCSEGHVVEIFAFRDGKRCRPPAAAPDVDDRPEFACMAEGPADLRKFPTNAIGDTDGLVGGSRETLPDACCFWVADGGMVSTAPDYLRFTQMLANGCEMDGVHILAGKTVALMASDHLPPDVAFSATTRAQFEESAPL
jgi:CubicO group peptidase (beta-lactamase class C family)